MPLQPPSPEFLSAAPDPDPDPDPDTGSEPEGQGTGEDKGVPGGGPPIRAGAVRSRSPGSSWCCWRPFSASPNWSTEPAVITVGLGNRRFGR